MTSAPRASDPAAAAAATIRRIDDEIAAVTSRHQTFISAIAATRQTILSIRDIQRLLKVTYHKPTTAEDLKADLDRFLADALRGLNSRKRSIQRQEADRLYRLNPDPIRTHRFVAVIRRLEAIGEPSEAANVRAAMFRAPEPYDPLDGFERFATRREHDWQGRTGQFSPIDQPPVSTWREAITSFPAKPVASFAANEPDLDQAVTDRLNAIETALAKLGFTRNATITDRNASAAALDLHSARGHLLAMLHRYLSSSYALRQGHRRQYANPNRVGADRDALLAALNPALRAHVRIDAPSRDDDQRALVKARLEQRRLRNKARKVPLFTTASMDLAPARSPNTNTPHRQHRSPLPPPTAPAHEQTLDLFTSIR